MKKLHLLFFFIYSSLFQISNTFAAYTYQLDPNNEKTLPENVPIGKWGPYNAQTIQYIIGNFIVLMLQVSGAVTIFFIVMTGYTYVTSFGKTEVIDKAKRSLTWELIGLLAIILSYAIVQNVLQLVLKNPQLEAVAN